MKEGSLYATPDLPASHVLSDTRWRCARVRLLRWEPRNGIVAADFALLALASSPPSTANLSSRVCCTRPRVRVRAPRAHQRRLRYWWSAPRPVCLLCTACRRR